MATRGERWEKTPFRAQRDELVDMVVEQFPWAVADVLGTREST